MNSNNYTSNTDTWLTVFNPKAIKSCSNKLEKEKATKNISIKSNSSSDKSIASDTDEDEEPEKPKDKYLTGQCFLKIKK